MTIPRPHALALLLALTLSATSQAQFPWFGQGKQAAESEIAWIEQPAEALAASAQSGKPILAYVTSAHCGYCRKMEKETWSDPAVARLIAQGFIPLKLHSDKHPEEVAALQVRAFPTTVLISAEGKAFAGKTGFLSPDKLTALVGSAAASHEVASRQASVN